VGIGVLQGPKRRFSAPKAISTAKTIEIIYFENAFFSTHRSETCREKRLIKSGVTSDLIAQPVISRLAEFGQRITFLVTPFGCLAFKL